MLDKLSLASLNTILPEDACRLLKGTYSNFTVTRTNLHNKVLVFRKSPNKKREKGTIAVHCDQAISGRSYPNLIVLNPSHFQCFNQMKGLLALLVSDPDELRVIRVDHTVDVPIEIDSIFRSLRFGRKKSKADYQDGVSLSGFELGKYPEHLSVYDKAKREKVPGPLSRIEFRQYGAKVPVKKFGDLQMLVNYMPFGRLMFLQTRSEKDMAFQNERSKGLILEELVKRKGFQGAIKLLNRHSNFQRDFGSLIERDPRIPDLNLLYRANLETFFEISASTGYMGVNND